MLSVLLIYLVLFLQLEAIVVGLLLNDRLDFLRQLLLLSPHAYLELLQLLDIGLIIKLEPLVLRPESRQEVRLHDLVSSLLGFVNILFFQLINGLKHRLLLTHLLLGLVPLSLASPTYHLAELLIHPLLDFLSLLLFDHQLCCVAQSLTDLEILSSSKKIEIS